MDMRLWRWERDGWWWDKDAHYAATHFCILCLSFLPSSSLSKSTKQGKRGRRGEMNSFVWCQCWPEWEQALSLMQAIHAKLGEYPLSHEHMIWSLEYSLHSFPVKSGIEQRLKRTWCACTDTKRHFWKPLVLLCHCLRIDRQMILLAERSVFPSSESEVSLVFWILWQ